MNKWLLKLLVVLFATGFCDFYSPCETYAVTKTSQKKNTPKKTTPKKTTPNKSTPKNNTKKQTTPKKSPSQNGKPKTSAEAKKKQAEAQAEIKLTEAQIKENEAKVSHSLAELGKIDGEIQRTSSAIASLKKEVKGLDSRINNLEGQISKNESELQKLRDEYLKAVKKMRVAKKSKSSLAFIFSSNSVQQALRRMRYLKEFSAWRERQTEEIQGKTADLKLQKESLAQAKEERGKALALQVRGEKKLEADKKIQEGLVATLKENGKALESHLKKKQAEARELNDMVSKLIAEEQRKAEEARKKAEEEARIKAEEARKRTEEEERQRQLAQNNVNKKDSKEKEDKGEYAKARKRTERSEKTSKPVNDKNKNQEKNTKEENSGTFESMKGKLPKPTNGSFAITSRFGRQELADLPGVEYDNPGIDAESDSGAIAKSVYKGKVSGVYLLPGYNTVVIVNHGNYYTVYGNISSPAVKNGDSVEQGASLGSLSASDANSARSAIHFEVWKNREKLNPEEWLGI